MSSSTPYPTWIYKVFECEIICHKCRHRMKVDEMASIGVCHPRAADAGLRVPQAQIQMICKLCHRHAFIFISIDQEKLMHAITAHFKQASEVERPDPEVERDSFDFGDVDSDELQGCDPETCEASDPFKRSGLFRKLNAHNDMPTKREIQRFLRKLKTTSFRRNTKSFKAFMRRLGIDVAESESDDHFK